MEEHNKHATHTEHHKPVHKEKGTITFKKSSMWKFGTFLFAALFLISVFGGFGGNSGAAPSAPTPTAPTNPPAVGGEVTVEINGDDPILGDADAEISIVEFSDFQCPFCSRVADGAIADFKSSSYFSNGEVNLIYKHFPLSSIHPYAQNAAEASDCANKQGKFWEYHDVLFANANALDDNSLKAHAETVGLDLDAFSECLDSNEFEASVKTDLDQGTSAGARGTPYFVVVNHKSGDTQVISGAVPWSNFESAINALQ